MGKKNDFWGTEWMQLKMCQWSEREKQILCINAYMWNLEKLYRWTYLQGRNRDADIKNRHVDTGGWGEEWVGRIGRLALTYIHTAAAAAAKLLQLCPTLCDPRDGSPPGSSIPGILQARTLECVAISFSNAWKWKVKVKLLSRYGI